MKSYKKYQSKRNLNLNTDNYQTSSAEGHQARSGYSEDWKPLPPNPEIFRQESKSEYPVPEFDADALLPEVLGRFVMDEAKRMPCAPDFIASALMVGLGSVVGARCGVKPKARDPYILTPNMFGFVVGDPSSRKSPATSLVFAYIDELARCAHEKYETELRAYEVEMKNYHAAVNGKGNAAAPTISMPSEPKKPQLRRFKSNDATTEKLAEILVHNPNGMLVHRDEISGLFTSWNKQGRECDKSFYLEAWNGTGSLNIDRVTRGSFYIPNLCLSVFGGIQPDILADFLAGINHNDGGIQRFQFGVYPDAVPYEYVDRDPAEGSREAIRALFSRFSDFDPVEDGASPANADVKLPYFSFDEKAQEIYISWVTYLNTVIIPNETSSFMQQHYGKFEKLFCSVALIMHLVQNEKGPIGVKSAEYAVAWCKHLSKHARRIYGLAEGVNLNLVRDLGSHIVAGDLKTTFTARDVVRKKWSGLTDLGKVQCALDKLQEGQLIRGVHTESGMGRPTVRYHVNPFVSEDWDTGIKSTDGVGQMHH